MERQILQTNNLATATTIHIVYQVHIYKNKSLPKDVSLC